MNTISIFPIESFNPFPPPPSSCFPTIYSTLKFYNFAGKLSDFFEVFMEGKTEYGSFFEFERRFKAELGGEDRVDHVFHTSFEELKKDSFGQIKKMGEFLGFERTDEFYERVVDKSSFQKVKAVRDQNEFYKLVMDRYDESRYCFKMRGIDASP